MAWSPIQEIGEDRGTGITPEEEDKVLVVARQSPELSSRQLAAWITDNAALPYLSRRCTAF